jgi:hypothetical protein
MFWFDDILKEEEWSLSAKLFAGLVFNPFSTVNTIDNSLFAWFLSRITKGNRLNPSVWIAKPEYASKFGRNDWRLHVENWQIAVECKFGDGIDINKDCLQYFEDLRGENRCVVVIASVSEFSELTRKCEKSSETVEDLKQRIQKKEVVFITWHEIVDAAIDSLPEEQSKILKVWSEKVKRNSLLLMPKKRISGNQIESLILEGKAADIEITHRTDARKKRESTGNLDEVLSKQGSPEWVCCYVKAVSQMCHSEKFTCLVKKSGWIDIAANKKSRSLTLFPLREGLALLISHPDDSKIFPGYLHLDKLGLQDVVPDRKNWFPRDRTIGVLLKNCEIADKSIFAESIKNLVRYIDSSRKKPDVSIIPNCAQKSDPADR